MKKIVLPLLSLFFLASCAYTQTEVKTVVNDANAEKRTVGNFTGIEVSNAIILYVSQGKEDAVAVSCSNASENKKIVTQVKNGILKISVDNGGWSSWGGNDRKIKAYISIRNIQSLTVSGASSCKINESIKATDLKLKVSGASSLKGDIKAVNLNVEVSGASNINITGSAAEATVEASGASSIKSFEFVTGNCTAEASGASNINIGVNGKLRAEASGASSIKYKGNGISVEANATGASSIKKKID